jgi:hypothetical protein
VHAAEHDVLGVGLRGQLGELERIAGQVGVLVDIGALVVVGEKGYTLAELFLGRNNARLAVVILQAAVLVEGGVNGNFANSSCMLLAKRASSAPSSFQGGFSRHNRMKCEQSFLIRQEKLQGVHLHFPFGHAT